MTEFNIYTESFCVLDVPKCNHLRFIFHFVFYISELPFAVLLPAIHQGGCLICGKTTADIADSPSGSKNS